MSVLRITRTVYDAMRVHGEEAYPAEACGALLDRFSPGGSVVETAVRATNVLAGVDNTRYQIDPAELVRIERDARRQGLGIAGFYHSHPNHAAQWSPTDLEEAHWLGCSYVITAISFGKAAETNSFLLAGQSEDDKKFEKEEIQIIEGATPEGN
jgi:proteasome lid subunit RPN8/RPN11